MVEVMVPGLVHELELSSRVSGAGPHLNHCTSINNYLTHLLFFALVFCTRTNTTQHRLEHTQKRELTLLTTLHLSSVFSTPATAAYIIQGNLHWVVSSSCHPTPAIT